MIISVCGSPGLRTILPRGAIHCKESTFLHIGLAGRKKILSLEEDISGHPLHWKDFAALDKTRSDLLFIYKFRGDPFVKVIILIQTWNGKPGDGVSVKLQSALMVFHKH